MTQLVTVEHRCLIRILHTVPKMHKLLNLHKFKWMARSLGSYSEEIFREFYTSYVATLRGSIDRQAKPAK